MTPQELKNSILQLAVQGKLVEQRAEEGTAEELYKKIQAEKQKLTAEKKIKKEKPLPEITAEEIPFDIPESWKWVRLGEIFSHNTGKALNSSKTEGTKLTYITTSNLYWNRFELDNLKEMFFTDDEVEKYTVKKGDLLVCEGGDVGRSAVWNYDEEMRIQNHIHKLRPYVNVNAQFFSYVFYLYKALGLIGGKGIGIKGLSTNAIHIIKIPLPPLEEQKRIVAKIEELLPQIDRYEKAWSKLEEFNKRFPEDMQKSILQYAVQGKLVEQRAEEGTAEELYKKIQAEKQKLIVEKKIKKEKPLPEITAEENPFDIPESWKWVRLGEIAVFQGGYAYKSTDYVPKSSNQIIRLGNIRQGNFLPKEKQVFISDDLANETQQYRIKENDILVSMTGTRRKKDYFYAVIIDRNIMNDKKYYLNQRVGCFRVLDNILPRFLWYVLKCEIIRQAIFLKETGTANQGNLSSEDIKMFVYVPLPPLEEQKRIVTKIEELLPLCEKLKK